MPSAFGYNPNVPHQVPWIYISTSNNVHLWLYWSRVVLRIEKIDATVKRVTNESLIKIQYEVMLLPSNTYDIEDWGEPTRTSVSWRQGCRHPTRNECMDWLAQISYWGSTRTSHISNHSNLVIYWMGHYLEGMVVDIQRETGVWVGLPSLLYSVPSAWLRDLANNWDS